MNGSQSSITAPNGRQPWPSRLISAARDDDGREQHRLVGRPRRRRPWRSRATPRRQDRTGARSSADRWREMRAVERSGAQRCRETTVRRSALTSPPQRSLRCHAGQSTGIARHRLTAARVAHRPGRGMPAVGARPGGILTSRYLGNPWIRARAGDPRPTERVPDDRENGADVAADQNSFGARSRLERRRRRARLLPHRRGRGLASGCRSASRCCSRTCCAPRTARTSPPSRSRRSAAGIPTPSPTPRSSSRPRVS